MFPDQQIFFKQSSYTYKLARTQYLMAVDNFLSLKSVWFERK